MARDNERYVYFHVGIPRDSALLTQLLSDAQRCGMEREPAKLLIIRLADFYTQTTTATIPTRIVPSSVREVSEVPETPEETMNEDIAALNANAALDEWG